MNKERKQRVPKITIEKRIAALQPGTEKARMAQLLYHLEMITICKAEGRTDTKEWTNSLANLANALNDSTPEAPKQEN